MTGVTDPTRQQSVPATVEMPFPQKENQLPWIWYITRTSQNGPNQSRRHHRLADAYQGQRSTIILRILQFLSQIYQGLLKNNKTTIQINIEGIQLGLDTSM